MILNRIGLHDAVAYYHLTGLSVSGCFNRENESQVQVKSQIGANIVSRKFVDKTTIFGKSRTKG